MAIIFISMIIPNMYSLEGIDGAGKGTQAGRIKDILQASGIEVELLKSPDTTLLGEFIREHVRELDPWVRDQLFLLDISTTLRRITSDSSKIWLWDRYIDSFYASNRDTTIEGAQELVASLPRPEKTFLLDVEPQYIFDKRKQALDHHSDLLWLQMKAERYQELLDREPERIVKIDGRQPPEEITEQIVRVIRTLREGREVQERREGKYF